ncbi:MAG: fibronectin type III domain-containing protein [Chloroflexi bacterium]|nr:fibronectin type III domain-containing protein [Chloroflexota bacterium]
MPNVNTALALIKVQATDAEQKVGIDVSETAFSITATPAVPASLKVLGVAHNQLSLEWAHDGLNVKSFTVERSVDDFSSINAAFTAPAEARTFTDVTVMASTAFAYRVRAVNGSVSSLPSDVLTVSTPEAPPPPDNGGGSSESIESPPSAEPPVPAPESDPALTLLPPSEPVVTLAPAPAPVAAPLSQPAPAALPSGVPGWVLTSALIAVAAVVIGMAIFFLRRRMA